MAITSRRVLVTTTATRLDATETDRKAGQSVGIYVDAATSVTVFIGGSDVDVSSGTPVKGEQHYSLDIDDDEGVYGIVASGTATVRVLEQGL